LPLDRDGLVGIGAAVPPIRVGKGSFIATAINDKPDVTVDKGSVQQQVDQGWVATCVGHHLQPIEYALVLRIIHSPRESDTDIGPECRLAFERAQRAQMRERQESPAQIRAKLSAGLDEGLERMRSIMLDRDSARGEATRAAEQFVRLVERKSKMTGAEMPSKRIEIVKVMDDEARREERERLDAELEAAGVDVTILPSIEHLASQLLATRKPVAQPATTPSEPAIFGGVALRRLESE
jgi:hypothetical protein